MTARTEMVARIADVLARWNYEHYDEHYLGVHKISWEDYRSIDGLLYLEPALEQADVLADVMGDVWDEGRDAGHEDTYLNLIEGRGDFDAAETPNPYRPSGDER